MKDYSHIKPGMYVLISELGDKKEEVLEAFCSAIGKGSCDPDFYSTESYLGIEICAGPFYVETYDSIEPYGDNSKLVTVDFILNGGDNKIVGDSTEILEELSKAQKELEEVNKRIEQIKSKLSTNQ